MSSEHLPNSSELPSEDTLQWVTTLEAAHRLGVSERTISSRVKAGKLPRREVQGRVLIGVPAPPLTHTPEIPSEDTQIPSEHLPKHSEDTSESDLVTQLRSENGWLRGQIEAVNVEKAELRRLMLADRAELQQLRGQIASKDTQEGNNLMKTPGDSKDTPNTKEKKRQWWEVWKK